MPSTPRTELWTVFANRPFAEFDPTVEMVDKVGFDGLWSADSQNIMPEAWVLLSRAAVLSSRLKLGTFVTTPLTRHAAVTASAAATMQEASNGRFVLGVGRGDSALAHLGSGPIKMKAFENYIDRVQGYLKGEDVAFDPADVDNPRYASLASLDYAHNPDASRLHWTAPGYAKVPVDIATSGPKVMAMAAAKADGVTFGLGAEAEAIKAAIERVRQAARDAGRDPSQVSVSALVSVCVHPNREVALQMAAGSAASISRWQLMQGAAKGSMSQEDFEELDRTRKAYDMTKHGETNSSHSAAMSPAMIDRFTIAGDPEYCIRRLRELMDLGLARITIPHRQMGADEAQQKLATELLLNEVIPATKG